jgi:RNA polymerase sigma-70 factor (ECF subfamily)
MRGILAETRTRHRRGVWVTLATSGAPRTLVPAEPSKEPKEMPERASVTSETIAAAKSGDLEAFECLVRTCAPSVYAHALRFFGDAEAASDATQEVWIKVLRALPGFDERAAFSTWLYRVTRNVCLDMLRAGRRAAVPTDPVLLQSRAGPDHAPGVVLAADLETAVRALSPEDRDAFDAVGLFDLSYAQAASVLGVPSGTVKSRVFRARRTLQALLRLDRAETA